MMRVKRYVWLCEDCLQPAVNDEWSSLDYYYGEGAERVAKKIKRGLRKLGPHLVPAFDSEEESDGYDPSENTLDSDFTEPCDCCGEAGLRFRKGYRFAILVTASKRYARAYDAVKGALNYMDGCALDDEHARKRVLNEIMESLHAAKLA